MPLQRFEDEMERNESGRVDARTNACAERKGVATAKIDRHQLSEDVAAAIQAAARQNTASEQY